MKIKKYIYLFLYYGFARKLPRSSQKIFGNLSKNIRVFFCKRIFKSCGFNVNIERNASFGKGFDIELGDYSGIGVNCSVPDNIVIGSYVMMGPEVLIHKHNHAYDSTRTPMALQGVCSSAPVVIGDDVWIGQRTIITPGRNIAKGTIIATGTVLNKDYPEYSIIGGNPSRLIKSRL